MGVVTELELEKALKSQERLIEEKTLPERLSRNRLISEARIAAFNIPLLGETLLEMGLIKKEQLEEALINQDGSANVYWSLKSEKLAAAIEIGFILNSTMSIPQILGKILRQANQVVDAAAITLMLIDVKTGELVFSVPTGPKSDNLVDIRIPPGEGIAGWVAEHKEAVLIPNAKEDPRFCSEIDKRSGFDTKSILCIPVKTKNKIIGVLEVINKIDGTAFTEEDGLLLNIVACQAALAIESARIYSELQESEAKYRALFDNAADVIAIVDTEGNLLELNDVFGVKSGYDREKIIGKNFIKSGILTASSTAKAALLFEEILAGKQSSTLEIESIRKDGRIVPYELKAALIKKNDKIVAVQAILRNISERKQMYAKLVQEKEKLKEALEKVKTLSGLIPICSNCKKIRDDQGYWNQVEKYVTEHSEAQFSHGICPECAKKLYPDFDLYDDEGKLI